MNTAILNKCIEELKKPRFSKDYVLGMLEALASMPEHPTRIEQVRPTFGVAVDIAPAATVTDLYKDSKTVSDPTGDMETPEQRAIRLGNRKVPPVFLGNIDRMQIDPAVHPDAKVDVTKLQ